MLTKTSQTAIQALLFIAEAGEGSPVSPGKIAEHLDASPSYMAKISTLLVKADILQTFRGMYGGVKLSHEPERIRLLQIHPQQAGPGTCQIGIVAAADVGVPSRYPGMTSASIDWRSGPRTTSATGAAS